MPSGPEVQPGHGVADRGHRRDDGLRANPNARSFCAAALHIGHLERGGGRELLQAGDHGLSGARRMQQRLEAHRHLLEACRGLDRIPGDTDGGGAESEGAGLGEAREEPEVGRQIAQPAGRGDLPGRGLTHLLDLLLQVLDGELAGLDVGDEPGDVLEA
jgi:hypothetical protein